MTEKGLTTLKCEKKDYQQRKVINGIENCIMSITVKLRIAANFTNATNFVVFHAQQVET